MQKSEEVILVAYNKIIYGAPGVGKSFLINKTIGKNKKIVTTFHPEYTYYDFVGGYKPVLKRKAEENIFHYYDATTSSISSIDYELNREKLFYEFIPGPFLEAYVMAWNEYFETGNEVFLVIEELNRGNSAAIFGETFQLLDRDKFGASEYYINVNTNISEYIRCNLGIRYVEELKLIFDAKKISKPDNLYSILLLPDNLSIVATMNTSDQSLFPLDSAFKRRWIWQYLPIDYEETKASGREIVIGSNKYNWGVFLENINHVIYKLTESEDKCLGPYFVKEDIITKDIFAGKVLFYLWTECFKDEIEDVLSNYFPKIKKTINGEQLNEIIGFDDFFDINYGETYIIEFLDKLGVPVI
ncbi:AAA family ATPase [Clostridium tepidum]|jgi:5-methylcytosine-specific restriction endonuclease McrBC GTP-binding regulatory subunit McrB|uniref:AAA family ATPase n=1 Tax=Clostridium tepidum TaxID=1962263 RepID=UPI00214A0FF6|nr:AAA family ATPase [Clostridium tepidum]MCR1934400.1 AAA family ATPase [Clostridium tepidum]